MAKKEQIFVSRSVILDRNKQDKHNLGWLSKKGKCTKSHTDNKESWRSKGHKVKATKKKRQAIQKENGQMHAKYKGRKSQGKCLRDAGYGAG